MSTMGFSKCVVRCGILVFLIIFHLATSVNGKNFLTTEERDAYLYQRSYGCTNLKALRPQELRPHKSHIPRCGCGYYGVRLHDKDPREDLYNVTVTTHNGRLLRFECIKCDICVGLKVDSICKPKQNTVCSTVCEDPCETYISVLKKCGTDKAKCPDGPTSPDGSTSTGPKVIPKDPQEPPTSESPIHRPPEAIIETEQRDIDYQSWLIVAAVVISASIIAVILLIIMVLCHQNKLHQNSNKSNNSSSNSLLPSTHPTPKAEKV